MSTAPIFHLTNVPFRSLLRPFSLFPLIIPLSVAATTGSPTDSHTSVSTVASDTRPRYPHYMHLSTANHSFHTLVNIIVTESQST